MGMDVNIGSLEEYGFKAEDMKNEIKIFTEAETRRSFLPFSNSFLAFWRNQQFYAKNPYRICWEAWNKNANKSWLPPEAVAAA